MVEQGIRVARVLAGNDGDAQARVATLVGLWTGELL
jgi:predicted dinucleotide-binding enzyme